MSNLKVNIISAMALLCFPNDGLRWAWPPQQPVLGGAGSIKAMSAASPVPFQLVCSLWLSLSMAPSWGEGLCYTDSGDG